MDRRAWWARVHGDTESDVTEHHIYISNKFPEGDVAGGHGVGGRKAHLRIVDLH